MVVFQVNKLYRPILDECSWAPCPPPPLICFQVSVDTCIVDTSAPKELESTMKERWFRLVRVCTIDNGENKLSFNVYIGR